MSFTFTVTRDNTIAISNPLTVNLTVGGTATFGVDYTVSGAASFTTTTASVIIPAGVLSAAIVATISPDAIYESDESIILTIIPTPGTSILGVNPSATAMILNDDAYVDPYAANVLLLLRFTGADNSTSIVDDSPNPKAIGVFGNTRIFNNKGVFDGNGDYLVIQKSALNMSAVSEYTIEAIFNTNSTAQQLLAATYNAPNQSGHLIFQPDFAGSDQVTYATPVATTGTNVHLALVRAGGVFQVYKQGVLVNSVTAVNFLQGGNFFIGGSPGDANIGTYWLNAQVTGFRISDVSRYSAGFTPPSSF